MLYPLTITPDDNGTFLVTSPHLPEVTTYGEDKIDALRRGADAVEEAIAARIARWDDVPIPDGNELAPAFGEERVARISLLGDLKLQLYLACRESNVTRADLTRRLGWAREAVERLFRFDHQSRVDQIDAAFEALGQHVALKPASKVGRRQDSPAFNTTYSRVDAGGARYRTEAGWASRLVSKETRMAKTPSHHNKPWTPAEVSQLREEARGNTPTRVIGLKHGRTPEAIAAKASEKGISLKPTNQRPYGTKKK